MDSNNGLYTLPAIIAGHQASRVQSLANRALGRSPGGLRSTRLNLRIQAEERHLHYDTRVAILSITPVHLMMRSTALGAELIGAAFSQPAAPAHLPNTGKRGSSIF